MARDEVQQAELMRQEHDREKFALTSQDNRASNNFDHATRTESNFVRAMTVGLGGLIIFAVQIAQIPGSISAPVALIILESGLGLGALLFYEFANWRHKYVTYFNSPGVLVDPGARKRDPWEMLRVDGLGASFGLLLNAAFWALLATITAVS